MPSLARFFMVMLVAAAALGVLAGCGGGGKTGTTSTAGTTTTPATQPTQAVGAGTLDGSWEGRTSSGRVAFKVSGSEVYDVALPKDRGCGHGVPVTITSRTPFRGRTFEVPTLPLHYTLYNRAGVVQSLEEQRALTGTFLTTTSARGQIVTRVTGGGASQRCAQQWTATRTS